MFIFNSNCSFCDLRKLSQESESVLESLRAEFPKCGACALVVQETILDLTQTLNRTESS